MTIKKNFRISLVFTGIFIFFMFSAINSGFAHEPVDPKIQIDVIKKFFKFMNQKALPTGEDFYKIFDVHTELEMHYFSDAQEWGLGNGDENSVILYCLKKEYPKLFSKDPSKQVTIKSFEIDRENAVASDWSQGIFFLRLYSVHLTYGTIVFVFDKDRLQLSNIYFSLDNIYSITQFEKIVLPSGKSIITPVPINSTHLGGIFQKCYFRYYEEIRNEKLPQEALNKIAGM